MMTIYNNTKEFRRKKLEYGDWEPVLAQRRRGRSEWREEKIERISTGLPEAFFRWRKGVPEDVLQVWMFVTPDGKVIMSEEFLDRFLKMLL